MQPVEAPPRSPMPAPSGRPHGGEPIFCPRLRRPLVAGRLSDSAPAMPRSVVIDRASTGATDRRCVCPSRDGDLRDPRQGCAQPSSRRRRRAARHLRRHLPTRRSTITCSDARRDAGRAVAGPRVRARRALVEQGPAATTGATTRSATSRRTPSTPPPRPRRSRCRTSSKWCKTLHQSGHRSDPRCRLQPYCEGNHLGPDHLVSKASTIPFTIACSRRQAVLHGLHGHRKHPQYRRTLIVFQLVMDYLRYWVTEMHVDGFRFDLGR